MPINHKVVNFESLIKILISLVRVTKIKMSCKIAQKRLKSIFSTLLRVQWMF